MLPELTRGMFFARCGDSAATIISTAEGMGSTHRTPAFDRSTPTAGVSFRARLSRCAAAAVLLAGPDIDESSAQADSRDGRRTTQSARRGYVRAKAIAPLSAQPRRPTRSDPRLCDRARISRRNAADRASSRGLSKRRNRRALRQRTCQHPKASRCRTYRVYQSVDKSGPLKATRFRP